MTTNDEIKELLTESKLRIKLHDYITEKSYITITHTSDDFFPMAAPWNHEEFASRLKRYEEATSDLISIMSLVGFWGTSDHLLSITIPAKHFALQLGLNSGNSRWYALRWYPLILLMYSLGIGVIAANNYYILYNFFQLTMQNPSDPSRRIPLVLAIQEGFSSVPSLFQTLPGHEREYSPFSKYLFDFFKTRLKNDVFTGNEYEDIFDRFELLFALQYAHEGEKVRPGRVWGPIGRFGWKYARGDDSNPFKRLYDEASRTKASWSPLKSGFFDGSYERFEKIASQYLVVLQGIH